MSKYVRIMRKKIGHAPLLICGASIIVYRDGKVLLQKRKDDGSYGYAGGSVELYEEVEQAARRELFEETGLTASQLVLLGVFSGKDMAHVYPNKDKASVVDIVFICTDFIGDVVASTNETTDCKWFSIDNMPSNITPSNIRPLKTFIKTIAGAKPSGGLRTRHT